MALLWSTVQLLQSKNLFRAGTSILDVGSSNIYFADSAGIASFVRAFNPGGGADLEAFADEIAARSQKTQNGVQLNKAFFGEVLTRAGMGYASVDIASGYRTTLIDLNSGRVPAAFSGAFDLVLNVGTSEHILDQANCFRFVHNATRPGGLMFHQLPASGFADHGYYCYTPRLFSDLASYNRYDIVEMWFDGPSAEATLFDAARKFSPMHPAMQQMLYRIPETVRDRRVEKTAIPDMSINVLMRRTTSARFLGALDTSTSVGPLMNNIHDAYASRWYVPRARRMIANTHLGRWARRHFRQK